MSRAELADSKVRGRANETLDYIEVSHLTSPLHREANPANYDAAIMLQCECRDSLCSALADVMPFSSVE